MGVASYLRGLLLPDPEAVRSFGVGRAKGWPALRAAHLKRFPACAATGSTADLEVHHVVPVHVDPERELDPGNLITLTRALHFHLAHGGNWRDYNPDVVRAARIFASWVANRRAA
jgi:5-methylcytosine-specific restriction endonuclease McrA